MYNNNNNIGIISVPCYARYAAILCTGPMFLIMNTVMYCTVLYCSKPAHHVQALHTNLMIQNCGHGAGPLRGEMHAEINVLSFNTCSEHAVCSIERHVH